MPQSAVAAFKARNTVRHETYGFFNKHRKWLDALQTQAEACAYGVGSGVIIIQQSHQ
jgi:hypothetical protein